MADRGEDAGKKHPNFTLRRKSHFLGGVLSSPDATFFIPDGLALEPALKRCTHLGIGAHQDDLEFMACHGILESYGKADKWFGGVICTDGGGSARTGSFAGFSNAEMKAVRRREQEEAAALGRFGAVIQLGYPSSTLKQPGSTVLADELEKILQACRPQIVYTHNPADKHDTHIAVFTAAINAIRRRPAADRPARVLGCEVWRDLDWMPDREKVALDVSAHEDLVAALNGVFASQIAGGKRYDLAVLGRRRANATFFDSHSVDGARMVTFAMDLTPLVQDDAPEIVDYVTGCIDRFRADVAGRLRRQLGK